MHVSLPACCLLHAINLPRFFSISRVGSDFTASAQSQTDVLLHTLSQLTGPQSLLRRCSLQQIDHRTISQMVFQFSVGQTCLHPLAPAFDVSRPSREFFYIQIEKYARQYLAEGVRRVEDLIITTDSDLYRVLNLHYNRSNQIEVSEMLFSITRRPFVCSGSRQLLQRRSSDTARIFPRHSATERSRTVVEEEHLQGDPTPRGSNTGLFQRRALDAHHLNSRSYVLPFALFLSLSLDHFFSSLHVFVFNKYI